MRADVIDRICREALSGGYYVFLTHKGVGRDVYPFGIRGEYFFCWCSLHPDRSVEKMRLDNIYDVRVSGHVVEFEFGVRSDFLEI